MKYTVEHDEEMGVYEVVAWRRAGQGRAGVTIYKSEIESDARMIRDAQEMEATLDIEKDYPEATFIGAA